MSMLVISLRIATVDEKVFYADNAEMQMINRNKWLCQLPINKQLSFGHLTWYYYSFLMPDTAVSLLLVVEIFHQFSVSKHMLIADYLYTVYTMHAWIVLGIRSKIYVN